MSANYTPEKEDLKILAPFKMQVLTNFPYIEDDFDALTNYQLLCKVVEYLNNVITETNEVTEQTLSLYNAFVSLQNYVNQEIEDFESTVNGDIEDFESTVNNRVDGLENYMNNYFNNLDVQEEINNKLDAMAANGSLTALISSYVDPIYQEYENEIDNVMTTQNQRLTQMEEQIDSATSGSPKGVYATVSALTSANPDHAYIYLVLEDGKWYYYSDTLSNWTAGGTYQATGLDQNVSNEIYNSALQINRLLDNTLKMNDYLFKDGYYYTFTNETATLSQEGATHYQISNLYPIKVTCGDTIEITQPAEHKYKIKIGIKQENGIIIYHYSWQSNLTSYRIFATGDMYISVQRDSMSNPSVSDFISDFTFRLKPKMSKLDSNDKYLEYEDLRKDYFINMFGNLNWDDNVTNKFYPGNDLRYYTGVPICLPYDLKVSLTNYNYALSFSEWSSNIPSSATLIEDYGNLAAEQPVILTKNHYYIIGVRNVNNTTMDYDTVMGLLKFEKIERKEIIDNFDKSPIKSINHRGYNTIAPENTISAFKLSKVNGFNIIETDVRKTSDGVFVLLHDASINRTARNADGTEISGTVNIADITYEQALDYDFGIWKSSEYAGTKIPTLDDLLELCKNINLYIYLELQSGAIAAGDLSSIFAKIKNYGMYDKVTVFSANAGLSRKIVEYDPYIRTCILTFDSSTNFKDRYNQLKTPYNEVVALVDFTWYSSVIDNLKTLNIPCEVWTIDSESDIYSINDYVTGIESNSLVAETVLYNHFIN